MKKVLFLPFLQIPSGHHQVADTLIERLKEIDETIYCEKVDILEYGYGKIERLVSGVYLKWIAHLPQVYSWIYRKSVCENMEDSKRFRHYELLFLSIMKEILEDKDPDIIVCTHALPSYLLSQLKQKGFLNRPVVNVYTDFFINRLWGVNGIDLHFAPSILMKNHLISRNVEKERVVVTGIPIHPKFTKKEDGGRVRESKHFIVTGGHLGVGLIDRLVQRIGREGISFSILCGKNERLYEKLLKIDNPYIHPVPYIGSREKMDSLYSSSDGIVTKPGGVTVSECLYKQKPIFVYHTLPGQEEMNLQQLQHLGVAEHLNAWETSANLETELLNFYNDQGKVERYFNQLVEYKKTIETENLGELILSV